MKFHRYTAVIALAMAVVFFSLNVEAKKGKKLYKKGVNHAKMGKYEEAIAYFEEARTRGAPIETLFNIGKCYEGLGLFHIAVEYYEEYLESPKSKKKKKIQKLIDELRLKPSTLTFNSDPEGAEVRQVLEDGTESKLGVTPLEHTIEAGEFTFTIHKEGFEAKSVTLETGYGKPFDLQISLAGNEVEITEPEKPEKHKLELGFPEIGLAIDLGLGVAMFPHAGVDFKAGAAFSFGIGYRWGSQSDTGFALGFRLELRSHELTGTDFVSGEDGEYKSMFAHMLAVPAVQIRLHDRLGLQLSMPLGFAVMAPTQKVPELVRVDLVRGYITGGSLALFDFGFGITLRVMIISGLFIEIEPIRMHIMAPLDKWRSVLFDMDMLVRLGFEF